MEVKEASLLWWDLQAPARERDGNEADAMHVGRTRIEGGSGPSGWCREDDEAPNGVQTSGCAD